MSQLGNLILAHELHEKQKENEVLKHDLAGWERYGIPQIARLAEENEDLKRLNAVIQVAFDANAEETIKLRNRHEELWRVKTSLEADVAAWKAKYSDVMEQALEAMQLLDKAAASITRQQKEIRELAETIAHRDCQIAALKQVNAERDREGTTTETVLGPMFRVFRS